MEITNNYASYPLYADANCGKDVDNYNSNAVDSEKQSYSLKASQTVDNVNIENKEKTFGDYVQAYRDEALTGLTKEEREEINKRIEEYKSNIDTNSKAGREGLEDFIRGLLKEFGYKGDLEEYAKVLTSSSVYKDLKDKIAYDEKKTFTPQDAMKSMQNGQGMIKANAIAYQSIMQKFNNSSRQIAS